MSWFPLLVLGDFGLAIWKLGNYTVINKFISRQVFNYVSYRNFWVVLATTIVHTLLIAVFVKIFGQILSLIFKLKKRSE